LTVFTAILQAIVARLELCKLANGFSYEVGTVVFRALGETPAYSPGTVELALEDIAAADSSSACEPFQVFTMAVRLAIVVDGSEAPVATQGLEAAGDIIRALFDPATTPPALATVQRPDELALSHEVVAMRPTPAEPAAHAGATLDLSFRVRVRETNWSADP